VKAISLAELGASIGLLMLWDSYDCGFVRPECLSRHYQYIRS
jgi:hypothetical protein